MAKILVVDDESAIRNFIVRVLERGGYEVCDARDGEEALQQLEMQSFDLLLTDIRMDRLDGVGLLRKARSRYPDLSIILLTGHATVESAVTALNEGAHQYLVKPARNEDILSAVESGLQARQRQQRMRQLEHLAEQMTRIVEPGARVDETTASTPSEAIGGDTITVGGLVLDSSAYRTTLYGESLPLTLTEFRLLQALAVSPGAAFDYVRLVELACGYTASREEAREIIGTHVRNLRRKLDIEPDQPLYVESVRGIGYRLIPA